MDENINKIRIQDVKDINFKGIATIQLFNAKTGKLEYETIEKNIVTNYYKELLKIYDNDFPTSGMLKDFFSGILLFNEKFDENPNKYVIPFECYDKLTGKASGTYSGTSPLIGCLNIRESKELENGYKFVWDFMSNQANGTIQSICLTTKEGVEGGFITTNSRKYINEYFDFYCPYAQYNPLAGITLSFLDGNNRAYCSFRNGDFSPAYKNYSAFYNFREKIGVNDNSTIDPYLTEKVYFPEPAFSTKTFEGGVVGYDKDYIYTAKFVGEEFIEGYNPWEIRKYNNQTFELISLHTMSLYKSDISICYDIICNNKKLFNLNGTEITHNLGVVNTIRYYFNNIIINENTANAKIVNKILYPLTNISTPYITKIDQYNLLFLIYSETRVGNQQKNSYDVRIPNYNLSTINNVRPFNKTKDQTLKITYTITIE